MDIKPEKLFLPLFVVSAVGAVYLLFRNTDGPTQSTVPNTSQSGVPSAYTQSGAVQGPNEYNVPAYQVDPSPLAYLSDPYASNPGSESTRTYAPSYLAYNRGPSSDLTKISVENRQPEKNGCGCNDCSGSDSHAGKDECPGCMKRNSFPDGNGTIALSSSRARQIRSSDGAWIENAASNINTWLASENQQSTVPSLTSLPASGRLQ